MSIKYKLILAMLGIGLGVLTLVTTLFYYASRKAIVERSMEQLTSVRSLKAHDLEDYVRQHIHYLKLLSQSPEVWRSIRESHPYSNHNVLWSSSFTLAPESRSNDVPAVWFVGAEGGRHHRIYTTETPARQETLERQLEAYLQATPLADKSLLGEQWHEDVKEPILFLSRPASDVSDGKIRGHFIAVMNMKDINAALHRHSGLGKTGESYIVGQDHHLRSRSRFVFYQQKRRIEARTPAVLKALEGHTGALEGYDYRNVAVLSAYSPLDLSGLKWIIVSEIDVEEVMKPIYAIRNRLLIIGGFITVVILMLAYYLAVRITRPVLKLRTILLSLSRGALPQETLPAAGNDEISQMTLAVRDLTQGLQRTIHFAQEIGGGNFEAAFTPLSREDVMGAALLEMRDRLKDMNGIVAEQNERIVTMAKRRLEDEVLLNRQRTIAIIEGQDNERKRLARELHDSLGGMLTVLKMKVGELDGALPKVKELKAMLDDTVAEVRRISNNLLPSVLIDFGLEAALRLLKTNMQRASSLEVDYHYYLNSAQERMNLEVEIALYRIAQEAVNNVLKYADTKKVMIQIMQTDSRVVMRIDDHGKGFDLSEKHTTFTRDFNGLHNMSERTRLLGGVFTIQTSPGKGVHIQVEVPLKNNHSTS